MPRRGPSLLERQSVLSKRHVDFELGHKPTQLTKVLSLRLLRLDLSLSGGRKSRPRARSATQVRHCARHGLLRLPVPPTGPPAWAGPSPSHPHTPLARSTASTVSGSPAGLPSSVRGASVLDTHMPPTTTARSLSRSGAG